LHHDEAMKNQVYHHNFVFLVDKKHHTPSSTNQTPLDQNPHFVRESESMRETKNWRGYTEVKEIVEGEKM